MRMARNWAILAVIALAIVALPGGGPTLNVVMSVISIAFFAGIALFGYRLWHNQRFTLDSLTDRQRFVLYASIGVAFLNFTATSRLFNAGGLGVLVWLVLLGLCSYGVMWVFISYRRYS
jgi:TRAP-type C4-dicarboxylate transport system permease small subunit